MKHISGWNQNLIKITQTLRDSEIMSRSIQNVIDWTHCANFLRNETENDYSENEIKSPNKNDTPSELNTI